MRSLLVSALLLSVSWLPGCSALLPTAPPTPSFYTLGSTANKAPTHQAVKSTGPTLLVNPIRAASGYDSARMVYTRSPQQLEHFARSEWADTPARMLAPWLVQVLSDELTRTSVAGTVGAVLLAPSSAVSEYALDTDLIRLYQDFTVQPSQARLTLRVALIQTTTRRVIAVREFDATQASQTDDPRGGVAAAQIVSGRVLQEAAEFCKAALAVK
jgi:cholesterol transport system auxiliary component